MSGRGDAGSGQSRLERFRVPLLLGLVCLTAFGLRVALSYHAVFDKEFVAFIETDAWYHMRLVDATVRHFPHRIWQDPYLVYPGGEPVNAGPFFDWVIAGAALVLGLGSPDDRLINVVGAFTPAVFGALTCIPVYVLGRELFSRRAGLWAAFIVGVLPGQILTRSLLGFTDHHCAEVLLSTCAFMFVALALNASGRWRVAFGILCGVSLGAYLLTWGGGSLVVAILVTWAALDSIRSRVAGDDAGDSLDVLWPAFLTAALLIAPWVRTRPFFLYDEVALGGGLLLLLVLWAAGMVTARHARGRAMYIAVLAAGGIATVTVAGLAVARSPEFAFELKRLSPFRSSGFVLEAAPLLRSPEMRPVPLGREFGASLGFALAAICLLAMRGVSTRAGSGAHPPSRATIHLLAVWSVGMFAATVGQVRFSYYLAISVALYAGLGCDLTVAWLQRLRPGGRHESDGTRGLENGVVSRTEHAWRWQVLATIVIAVVVAASAGGSLARNAGKIAEFSDDWYDALQWLRSATPEPFGNDDAYYRPEDQSFSGGRKSGYGVLAWWDHGYWITRVARRVPITNPRQTHVAEAASFLLAQEPGQAGEILTSLGGRYVVVDARLQSVQPLPNGDEVPGYFLGIAIAGGREPTDYCGTFRLRGEESQTRTYCYPEYYRTMAVRLFAFGGEAVAPASVSVIQISPPEPDDKGPQRLLDERRFPSYETAEAFVRSRPTQRWRIASDDPLATCVPLEAVSEYQKVFVSLGRAPAMRGGAGPPNVQIYEVAP